MARIRTIKPEFWTSEQIMECSLNARLLFIGMWNFADDYGRMAWSAKSLKALIFPGDDIDVETIHRMVDELSSNGLIGFYTIDGKEYLFVTGWQHQKIDRPQPAKYPAPLDDHSTTIRRMVSTDRKGKEGKGREESSDSADALSDAGASVDHRQRLFREGLAKLAKLTGKGPDACRSFVGKCLKAAEDDAVIVLGLIEDAERNRIIDPAAWIVARLKPPGRGPPETAFQRGQRETREILDVLGRSSKNGGAADIGLLSDDRRK